MSTSSSFQGLSSPAPIVEAATVERQRSESPVHVEAAKPSGTVVVEPAKSVGPATAKTVQQVDVDVDVDVDVIPGSQSQSKSPPLPPKISPSQASKLSIASLKQQQQKFGSLQFSSKAAVIKGGVEKSFLRRLLPLCYDERDFVSYGEVVRYIYVHGNVIFVYVDGNDEHQNPLYAIPIDQSLYVEVEDPRSPDPFSYTISPRPNTNQTGEDFTTVLLKDHRVNSKIMYQITFDRSSDKSVVKRFMDVITMNSKVFGGTVAEASIVHTTKKPRKNTKYVPSSSSSSSKPIK